MKSKKERNRIAYICIIIAILLSIALWLDPKFLKNLLNEFYNMMTHFLGKL